MDYEAVIGLEVHAQLLTRSKMFCSCAAKYLDASPNTTVCPVCLALPGVLPVVNREAVKFFEQHPEGAAFRPRVNHVVGWGRIAAEVLLLGLGDLLQEAREVGDLFEIGGRALEHALLGVSAS